MVDIYAELAKRVLAHCPEEVAQVQVRAEWYMNGDSSLIATPKDRHGQVVQCRGIGRIIFDFFEENLDQLRELEDEVEGAHLANIINVAVRSDGTVSVQKEYDPLLDERRNHEIRETLENSALVETGAVYRDSCGHFPLSELESAAAGESPSPETRESAQEAPSTDGGGEESELTVPQLFGFIHEELTRNVPEDWTSIIVEGEVFEEDGRKAVSMVSWYTTPERPEPVRFVPENSIGPMNALIELNERNAPTGEPWRRVRLVYHTNGMVDVDTDPEAGT